MSFRSMDVPQRNVQQLSSSSKSDRKKIRDRKKNVIKKAEELSKLCGVDVCLIMYPRQSNIAETWPQDPEQVKRIVDRYKQANPVVVIRDERIIPKGNLEESRAPKSSDEESLERREMLYPTWDDRLDYCSEEELIRLVASLDAKLEASTKRIDSLSTTSSKSHHHMMNSNLNPVVPVREISDLGDPRSSRNCIPMQLRRRSS